MSIWKTSKLKTWTKVETPLQAKVIVPFVKESFILQVVVDSLRLQFVQPELKKIDKKDEDGYWKLLKETWEEGEEFFVVEHDCVIWPGAINLMKICPEPWCTLPSLCHGRMITTTFGCVKFSQELIDTEPNVWDEIAERKNKIWFRQDANFSDAMGWPDVRPCVHFPPIIHLNEIQWPDAISKRDSYKKIAWQHVEKYGTATNKINPDEEVRPLIKVNDAVVDIEDQKELVDGVLLDKYKEDSNKSKLTLTEHEIA